MKERILEEYKKGNIVFLTIDGLRTCPISEFVQQPVEGLLYDLNRDSATILSFIDDPKWVNDYALTQVLKYLCWIEDTPTAPVIVAKLCESWGGRTALLFKRDDGVYCEDGEEVPISVITKYKII